MNGKNVLNHQDRLEIVLILKLELLRDLLFTRKYRATLTEINRLISDLIEIYQNLKSMGKKIE